MVDRNVLYPYRVPGAACRKDVVRWDDRRTVVIGEEIAAAQLVPCAVVLNLGHELILGLTLFGADEVQFPVDAIRQRD